MNELQFESSDYKLYKIIIHRRTIISRLRLIFNLFDSSNPSASTFIYIPRNFSISFRDEGRALKKRFYSGREMVDRKGLLLIARNERGRIFGKAVANVPKYVYLRCTIYRCTRGDGIPCFARVIRAIWRGLRQGDQLEKNYRDRRMVHGGRAYAFSPTIKVDTPRRTRVCVLFREQEFDPFHPPFQYKSLVDYSIIDLISLYRSSIMFFFFFLTIKRYDKCFSARSGRTIDYILIF